MVLLVKKNILKSVDTAVKAAETYALS